MKVLELAPGQRPARATHRRLPLMKLFLAPQSNSSGNTHSALKTTVVIADDHPQMLEMVAGVLRPSFTILAQAEDGDIAFRAITELRPQLAVLDLSMPRMHGIEVAKQLSATQSLTKVVFLTLHAGEEFLSEARRYGHGYVLKSRLHSDLIAALHAALQGRFFASTLAHPARDRELRDIDPARSGKRLDEQGNGT